MQQLDLKKQYKHLYQPSARAFSVVDVPPLNFLMIDGAGDPNTSADFQAATATLYALSYTLKFGVKQGKYGAAPCDYPVMALEGLWWAEDMRAFSLERKGDWLWTLMIMQPDIITPEMAAAARAEAAKKKDLPALSKVRLETYHEGPSAQIMYVGPFKDEGPTIARLHAFIQAGGHQLRGKHHEIYLRDPRRTAPDKLKTVIRQPLT